MSDDTLKVELPQELAEAVLPYAYLLFVEADPERTDHLLRRVGVHVKRAMSEPHDATVVAPSPE